MEKMRFEAVKCMSRAYRPTVPVQYIAQVLGFSAESEGEGGEDKDLDGLEECTEWLKAHGACLVVDSNGEMLFDAKVILDFWHGCNYCRFLESRVVIRGQRMS